MTHQDVPEKKYAVQYVRPGLFGVIDIVEDTPPISYEEAVTLYFKHRDEFIKLARKGEEAQLVVWEDVGDDEHPHYGSMLVDLDTRDNLTFVGNSIYKNVPVRIGEPDK